MNDNTTTYHEATITPRARYTETTIERETKQPVRRIAVTMRASATTSAVANDTMSPAAMRLAKVTVIR